MTQSEARSPLMALDNVSLVYRNARRTLRSAGPATTRAVWDVSLAVTAGEAFGLVGESGSGKTSIGRMMVRLESPTSGRLLFRGADIHRFRGDRLLAYRREAQIIFQNPFSSLNPRRTIRQILEVGPLVHRTRARAGLREWLAELVEKVGLSAEMLDRYPHQLSGGQRQRVVIARALTVNPEFIVADEPVSALDVSIQAQVLNLLRDLQAQLELTVVLIAHDLRVVSFFCDRVGVLYLGRLMEIGPRDAIVGDPRHPYTIGLMAAAPQVTPQQRASGAQVLGEISDEPPPERGCVFAPRCWLRKRLNSPAACIEERPELQPVGPDHAAACHFIGDVAANVEPVGPQAVGAQSPRTR